MSSSIDFLFGSLSQLLGRSPNPQKKSCVELNLIEMTFHVMLFNVLKKQCQAKGFTVILVEDSATAGGSRTERDRLFPVMFDFDTSIADTLCVEENFFRVFHAMRMDPLPFSHFEMDDEVR